MEGGRGAGPGPLLAPLPNPPTPSAPLFPPSLPFPSVSLFFENSIVELRLPNLCNAAGNPVSTPRASSSASKSSGSISNTVSSKAVSGPIEAPMDDTGLGVPLPPVDIVAKGVAHSHLQTPHGLLRFYDYGDDAYFMAYCIIKGHPKSCRRTKAAYGSSKKNREGQGRPVAFLYWWLQQHSMPHDEHTRLLCADAASFSIRKDCRGDLLRCPVEKSFSRTSDDGTVS